MGGNGCLPSRELRERGPEAPQVDGRAQSPATQERLERAVPQRHLIRAGRGPRHSRQSRAKANDGAGHPDLMFDALPGTTAARKDKPTEVQADGPCEKELPFFRGGGLCSTPPYHHPLGPRRRPRNPHKVEEAQAKRARAGVEDSNRSPRQKNNTL